MVRQGKLSRSYGLQTGDVIGFVGTSWLSSFINLMTFGIPRWSLSHVGLVVVESDDVYVVEALIGRGVIKRPYIESVRGETCWLYPLSRENYAHEDRRMRRVANSLIGIPYSSRKAFWAGMVVRLWTFVFRREDRKGGMFCSEVVAHVLSEGGPLTTGNTSAFSPNALCRRLVMTGVCEPPIKLPRIQ